MRFNNICQKIGIQALGKPGTIVEAIVNFGEIRKGLTYEVNGVNSFENLLKIKGINYGSFFPSRFRKAEQ